jgi:hypothetical protein
VTRERINSVLECNIHTYRRSTDIYRSADEHSGQEGKEGKRMHRKMMGCIGRG